MKETIEEQIEELIDEEDLLNFMCKTELAPIDRVNYTKNLVKDVVKKLMKVR